MYTSTDPDINSDMSSGATARRERWIVGVLAAILVSASVIGRVTLPMDIAVLDTATTAADVDVRVGAMNSLIVRGYWDERPLAELVAFLESAPPELEGFVLAMHGSLLRKR